MTVSRGGILLAKKWGTQVMENPDLKDGELTAAKVNVALPEMPPPESLDEQMMMIKFISENLYAQNFAMPQVSLRLSHYRMMTEPSLPVSTQRQVVVPIVHSGVARGESRTNVGAKALIELL